MDIFNKRNRSASVGLNGHLVDYLVIRFFYFLAYTEGKNYK